MTKNLTWNDISALIDASGIRGKAVFGVPRGGSVVAALSGSPVDNPEDADIIVDDIIDSGATMARWRARFPGKPFVALVNKADCERQWISFPWERNADHDETVEDNITRIIQYIGEDPHREGLKKTPARVAKAWGELTAGYRADIPAILATQFNAERYDQMIALRGVEFHSICEHHMLPFSGKAWIAYLPAKTVLGLSKMARLLDAYAKRLQIQERLTQSIADALWQHLQPRGVAVTITAKHGCMVCRGVGKQHGAMTTTALHGVFRENQSAREEFIHLCSSE